MPLVDETKGGLVKVDYHINEKLLLLTNNYSGGVTFGDVEQTVFDQGEGWMGNTIAHTSGIVPHILTDLTQRQISAAPPQLEILLVGLGPMQPRVEIYAGTRLVTTVDFTGFASQKISSALNLSDIAADESLSIGVKAIGVSGIDRVSVGYI
jgi:hypothetical protein